MSVVLPPVIRSIRPEDEPFLEEMLYQALYVAEGEPPFPREIVEQPEIRRYVEGWGRPDDFGFIAENEKTRQPIGAAWARLMCGEARGYGYIDEATPELTIAVLPEYRGGGVGRRLLERLLAASWSRYPALCLSVSAGNPAQRLYRRLGFEIVKASAESLTMKVSLSGRQGGHNAA